MPRVRTNHCGSSHRVAIAAAVIAVWTRSARADDNVVDHEVDVGDGCDVDPRPLVDTGRTLGGHRYIPFSLLDWGFVVSAFGATSGIGVIQLDPKFLGRSFRQPRFDLIGLEETFSGSVALTPWLGIHLHALGAGVMAKALRADVAVAAQALYGGEGGVLVRLIRTANVQVTASVDFGGERSKAITPVLLPGSPRENRNIWSIRPALAAAITLSPAVGLQASGSFDYVNPDGLDAVHRWTAGLGMSVMMTPVPVTVMLGGNYVHEDTSDSAATRLVLVNSSDANRGNGEVGVFYNGRTDLDLGGGVVMSIADDDRRYFGYLRLDYYF